MGRWVFAAMFVALALFSVVRLVVVSRVASRVVSRGPAVWGGGAGRSTDVSRAVMSLGMVAMLAPGVDPLPRLCWQMLFASTAGRIATSMTML